MANAYQDALRCIGIDMSYEGKNRRFDGFVDRFPKEFLIAKPSATGSRARVDTNEKFLNIIELVDNSQSGIDCIVNRRYVDTNSATSALLNFFRRSKPPRITVG